MIKTYQQWFDEVITYIGQKYDCQIRYPRDYLDVESNTLDGIGLDFNRVDVHIHISNFVLHQMYLNNPRGRADYLRKNIDWFIEDLYLNLIRK